MLGFMASNICSKFCLTSCQRLKVIVVKGCQFNRPRFFNVSANTVFNKDHTSTLNHLYLKENIDTGLREDDQYPDWLWQINKEKQNMEDLNTESGTYRRLLRKKERRDENERRKMKRF